MAKNTRDMIENALMGAYWIPAQVTGLRQWELSEDESQTLARAVQDAIGSLGSRRGKKVLATIDKYAPGVSLAITALIITMPRVALTRAYLAQKANANRGPTGTEGRGGADAPAGDAAPSSASEPASHGGDWSNVGGNLRSLTLADLPSNG